jgi:hypothetical protein
VRIKAARHEADLDIREDRIDERLHEIEEREARLTAREEDLAGYVANVQQRFTAA